MWSCDTADPETRRRHKMWLGFPNLPPASHNNLCASQAGVVLHHCSYSRVNGWFALSANNPLTCGDAAPLVRIAPRRVARQHRFRAGLPHVVDYRLAPNAANSRFPSTGTSVCRATSGTGSHPRETPLWNGRGQPCEFQKFPVGTAVDKLRLPTGTTPALRRVGQEHRQVA